MNKWKKIKTAIKRHKNVLIATHVNPDPDALCSELAMAAYVRTMGKRVAIVNEERAPQRFEFFPGIRQVKGLKKVRKTEYDLAIVLDCGELNRVGKVKKLIGPNTTVINIDHHVTNDRFGTINVVEPKASSTAEMLYVFFQAVHHHLTNDLAMLLYTGIMTDTGSFRFENTTARTHAIAGDLMRYSFSVVQIYRRIYESIPLMDLKEFTKLISHFDVLCGGQVVLLELSQRSVAKFSSHFDLRDAIFKFLRSMHGVEVFVILTEVGRKKTRVNLRSTHTFDVARLASHFDGGGHKRASGCLINGNMARARRDILRQIRKTL